MSKIALFTNSIYTMGGEQRVVCVMANEFVKRHEVTIFTMDAPQNNNNLFQLSPKVKVSRYLPYKNDIVSFLLRAMTHIAPWIVYDIFPVILKRAYCCKRYAKKMQELIGTNFDVVIATAWQLSIILGQVCKMYTHNFKAIGWEHSSFEAYFKEKYVYLYHNEKLFKENIKHLDYVIVLNSDYAEKYKKYLGIECKVIFNPKSFSSQEKSRLVNKYFVTCGRFDFCKGYDLLIEAFNIFAQSDKDWKLVIAGEGKLKNILKKRVDKLKLNDRIFFLGKVDDVQSLLIWSSVYLLSSRFEGFPMGVVEACEIGLPVLAFDIPAMIPFKENGAAETIECFDVKKFAEAMQNVAFSFEKRQDLGMKGIILSQKLLSEKIAEYWERYFEKESGI